MKKIDSNLLYLKCSRCQTFFEINHGRGIHLEGYHHCAYNTSKEIITIQAEENAPVILEELCPGCTEKLKNWLNEIKVTKERIVLKNCTTCQHLGKGFVRDPVYCSDCGGNLKWEPKKEDMQND